MSTAIATVFYGAPATPELEALAEANIPDDLKEDFGDDAGTIGSGDVLEYYDFDRPYSGNGDPDYYWGIDLDGFSEGEPTMRLSEYMRQPTAEQREELEVRLSTLPDWLANYIREHLDVWVIWGSS